MKRHPALVTGTWGATARQEQTSGSDLDVLCWSPEVLTESDTTAAAEHLQSKWAVDATYLDMLLFDGRKSLSSWARATATDLQAVLFASDLEGPPHLVQRFRETQDELWGDVTLRARELWMLVSETILHPHTMGMSRRVFRPEKYLVGGTRSFVTVAESHALLFGLRGRLTTLDGLRAVEAITDFPRGELVSGYQESMRIRAGIEQRGVTGDLTDSFVFLGELVLDALRKLVNLKLPWLQEHAGISVPLLERHLKTLFNSTFAESQPAPASIHAATSAMIAAFSGTRAQIERSISDPSADWFVHYAATANPLTTGQQLDRLATPRAQSDVWTQRNLWLWSLRHPNVAAKTARRVLNEPGHRDMEYAAAQRALERIGARSGIEVP